MKKTRLTKRKRIALCYAESAELEFQAKNHRSYARNGAKTQEEKDWHLGAALYKEAQARGYLKLAAKIEQEPTKSKKKK
jgi:hypothetical protein